MSRQKFAVAISWKKIANAISQKSIPEVIVCEGKKSWNHDGKCAGQNRGFPAHGALPNKYMSGIKNKTNLSAAYYSQCYQHLCPSIAEFVIVLWQTVGKAKTKPCQQFVIRQCKGEGSGQQYKPLA